MKKKLLIPIILSLVLLSGCTSHTISDAIDKDLGTNISQVADEIDEFTNNDIADIDYADKLKNALDTGKDIIDYIDSKNNTISAAGTMEVHFIDVGQGDCTLICCNNEYMLIDAGDNDKGTLVQNYLQKRGISNLKYVIGTHCDADHYGGLDVIITKFNCEGIILSNYRKDTRTCEDVYSAAEYKGYSIAEPIVGNQYTLGSAIFTILAPNNYDYGDEANNYSIALMLQNGDNRFLFTGDAEEDAENDMMKNGLSLKADVYKVGHHGSSSSSTQEFMDCVNPKYAVISCGKDNEYGHPHAETINRLMEMEIETYRTDEQGSIIATSDGTNITWNCQSYQW